MSFLPVEPDTAGVAEVERAAAAPERGLELFGAPVEADAEELGPMKVGPEEIRLVAYEALVEGPAAVPQAAQPPRRLFN